ncbi:hypothetical protein N836_05305 [Leptolyngbya sp. Heron Island J]|uniref:hypothetical protein n=1 Tax=Leptolyngbya sp. Heron Island J TaxID=1385935 RepID=UPI0003B9802A|nr:hypothetical protein [Leptolyngbya sp. Heron Island J]ESA36981.1 hypothetical protein N836_05305 [Leptolyngbya sp. Heron Island J]
MSFTSKIPQLPHTDDGEVNSLRHEVNPAIALNTLTEIYTKVQQYQVQLRQLTQKIHQIYAEGPVVSGWLASEASLNAAVKYSNRQGEQHHPGQAKPVRGFGDADLALFRHGDANDLMNYLSALENAVLENGRSLKSTSSAASSSSGNQASVLAQESCPSAAADTRSNPSQYYLCRLTSCGTIQAEQCPPDQVPVLSMAIARYRRLNQLMTQKQAIETKLQSIVDILRDVQTVLAD